MAIAAKIKLKLKLFIQRVPLAVSGLALALASLGNLLRSIEFYGEGLRYICGALSLFILLIFVSKLIFDFSSAMEELKKPLPLSVLPTSTMALMLLCAYAHPYAGFAAVVIWHGALAVQVCIMCLFIKRFVVNFTLSNVFPTWFVSFVGIVTASVTAPVMNAFAIGQAVFYFGFSLYFAVAALVLYRMIKLKGFPEAALPTIAIFAAPVNLCLAGYFYSFPLEQQNETFVYFMLYLAAATYILVSIVIFIVLLKVKFYPTYAALGFPYVISAVSFRLCSTFFSENGHTWLILLERVSFFLAILMTAYALARYALYFAGTIKS
jgi:exfoliative toxin A/B